MLAMLLIENVLMLLMMLKDCCRSVFRYCVVVCISQLPLPLLLPDCVWVAAAVVFLLHLVGGRHGDKDVDRGRRLVIVDVDNGLLTALEV